MDVTKRDLTTNRATSRSSEMTYQAAMRLREESKRRTEKRLALSAA